MATIEITIDDEQMEPISEGRGLAAVLRPVLNEILEVERPISSGQILTSERTSGPAGATVEGH